VNAISKRIAFTGLALALAVAACTPVTQAQRGAGPTAASTPAAAADRDTFLWLRNVDGFESIDDEHIVLTSGTKRALVKTFGRCDGLRYAETIAVDAPLGYLDRSAFGNIIYRQSFTGPRRCPIDRIVAVKDTKEARALVEQEKAEKEKGEKK
jgi:Family of unknown function (DUF6491)